MSAATAPRLWHIVTSSPGEQMQCAPLFSEELSGSSVWQPTFPALWDGAECSRGCPGGPGAAPHRQATNFFSFRIHMGRIQLGPRGRVLPNETCALFTRKGERAQPFSVLRLGRAGVGKRALTACSWSLPQPLWCAHVYAHRWPASHGSSSGKDTTGRDTTLNEPEPRRPQARLRNAP